MPRPAILLLVFALLQSSSRCDCTVADALALPSFRRDGRHSGGDAQARRNNAGGNGRKIETRVCGSSAASTTDDDDEASRLWTMRPPRDGDDGSSDHRQRGLFGFNFKDRPGSEGREKLVPFGPVPRGGSVADIVILPASGGSAASAALEQPRQNPLASTWTKVRYGTRGVRRGIVRTALFTKSFRMNIGNRDAANRADVASLKLDDDTGSLVVNTNINGHSAIGNGRNNGLSMLRVGGKINRMLRERRDPRAAAASGVSVAARMETVDCLDGMGDMEAWSHMETAMQSLGSGEDDVVLAIETADKSDSLSIPIIGRLFQRKDDEVVNAPYESSPSRVSAEAMCSRGGSGVEAVANKSAVTASPLASSGDDRAGVAETETYVIETPLFPIILPKAFQPPSAASASSAAGASVASLEISVSLEEVAASDVAEAKPSAQLLQAATLPLLPKALMDSFTGREFYYPESVEALVETGVRMASADGDEWVDWSGEKKTENFLRAHGSEGRACATEEWYQALDSSWEVLVWAGKSISRDGYGSELPFIKTTSIIHQSPKYLAELLMDSSRVKVYNKMSLGRTDEKVFQEGVDTQGGSFGDGESKVVRNLTKPPMVSSVIEFVTLMHARRLRPSDMEVLPGIDGDGDTTPAEGYIVVSRAVTGGEWSAADGNRSENGEKLVRNEILLGINLLRAVPGEPEKTELTAVTHVQSPMIPVMLAKGAGVKGAVDFVRDIRALP